MEVVRNILDWEQEVIDIITREMNLINGKNYRFLTSLFLAIPIIGIMQLSIGYYIFSKIFDQYFSTYNQNIQLTLWVALLAIFSFIFNILSFIPINESIRKLIIITIIKVYIWQTTIIVIEYHIQERIPFQLIPFCLEYFSLLLLFIVMTVIITGSIMAIKPNIPWKILYFFNLRRNSTKRIRLDIGEASLDIENILKEFLQNHRDEKIENIPLYEEIILQRVEMVQLRIKGIEILAALIGIAIVLIPNINETNLFINGIINYFPKALQADTIMVQTIIFITLSVIFIFLVIALMNYLIIQWSLQIISMYISIRKYPKNKNHNIFCRIIKIITGL